MQREDEAEEMIRKFERRAGLRGEEGDDSVGRWWSSLVSLTWRSLVLFWFVALASAAWALGRSLVCP